ncbi:MAG: DUF5667 domain-containing protein [Chloroflexi bacterium]|nr:DUF5667 domain-containing protein [Chloroflexota bacterium]
MNETTDLAEDLDTCLGLIRAGMSMDECLVRYPNGADELRPLLSATVAARASFGTELPLASRLRISNKVMSAWDERASRPARRWWSISIPSLAPKWAAAAAALVLALVGGTGTVSASADALPGDTLYAIKGFSEEARIWFAWAPEEKVSHYSDLVEERVRELTAIAEAGDYQQSGIAVARLAEHLDDIDSLADANANLDTQLADAASVQQEALLEVQGLLQDAPVDARAELGDAVNLLQSARERIDSALDSLRQ